MKENNEVLEQRMFGLVPYNISEIQKGIQYGHALQEFNNKMEGFQENVRTGVSKLPYHIDLVNAFDRWKNIDKTFILLNGGTTNNDRISPHYGSMNQHLDWLRQNNVHVAKFYEPDLGNQLTAVVFLVDELVFDKEKYPDYAGAMVSTGSVTTPFSSDYDLWKSQFGDKADYVIEMREFLSQFRLA